MAEPQEKSQDCTPYEEFLNRFTRDRDRIFAFVCSLVASRADAEDVFQQCSLVLWRKFETFEQDQNFLHWACGVARYEVFNYLRTAGRNRLRFDDDLVNQLAERRMESLSQYEERLIALRACLQRLSPDQRKLIDAAYGNESTVKRLAEASGSAVQTLYNRLGGLRRRLFECVQSKLAASG